MLNNVSTRKYRRGVRLPEAICQRLPATVTQSPGRRVGLWRCRLSISALIAADLLQFVRTAIQIDGLHVGDVLALVAALGPWN